jgi:hypothetical protein
VERTRGKEDTFLRECDSFSVTRLVLLILVRLRETGVLFITVISIEV